MQGPPLMRLLSASCLILFAAGCFSPVIDDAGTGGGSGGGSGGGVTGGGAGGGGVTGGGSGGGVTGGGSGGGVTGGGTGGGAFGGGTGGGSLGGCANDAQCPAGEVCYVCNPGAPGVCDVGCNPGHACPQGQSCFNLNITCFTCPCLDTECRGPSCVDSDIDGYVPGAACGGFRGGDCDPIDGLVNPGAGERCNNGKDDDCDGLMDSADSDCGPPMCTGGPPCLTSWNCGLGLEMCEQGCCRGCPIYAPPQCPPTDCMLQPTIQPDTGCKGPPGCYTCSSGGCPAVYLPVCAASSERFTDPRTFGNACEAGLANMIVVYTGPCLRGEGLNCGSLGTPQGCGPGTELYCRDACPECDADLRRCTKKGVCLNDLDCPAGLTPPAPLTCSNGTQSTLRCVDHTCVQRCP